MSEAGMPPVDADPQRLLQVLANLVGNAIKFTQPGGRVELLTRAVVAPPDDSNPPNGGGQAVRFTVSDNGPGISEKDLAHVFDWFWQSPSGERSGAGLGLAIARGLIEAHRRVLHAESTPGSGSRFWFTLPVWNDMPGPGPGPTLMS
jgi:signal transduction histidine kinase